MIRINYQKIIVAFVLIAIIIRIFLLFFNPISMWADPVQRYIPDSYRIIDGDLTFYTPLLLSTLNAIPILFFNSNLLEFFWKFIPFLFFLGSVFFFLMILKKIELNNISKIFLLGLFLFNVYSLLTSTTVMQEFLVLFFTLSLFYIFESKRANFKIGILITILSTLLLYTKDSGLFIFVGFFLYTLLNKRDKKEKFILISTLLLSFCLYLPWMIKNYYIYGMLIGGNGAYGKGFVQNGFFDFKIKIEYFKGILEMAYRIPASTTLIKASYQGIIHLISRVYYLFFISFVSIFTICVITGLVKYFKQYKRYIYLVLPILSMVTWLAFFSPFHFVHDFGRYMFSFYFVYFFFGLKFIENINKNIIRRGLYLVVLGIIILSIFTSIIYSVNFHYKDQEIRKVNDFLKEDKNFNEKFTTNDAYTEAALSFYSSDSRKDIRPEKNKLDPSIICEDLIYTSNKYAVSFDKEYEICMN